MTDPNHRTASPHRKTLFSAATTLLAFAEISWLLPATHAPHASLALQLLTWAGLALTVLLVLLAVLAQGTPGERKWLW